MRYNGNQRRLGLAVIQNLHCLLGRFFKSLNMLIQKGKALNRLHGMQDDLSLRYSHKPRGIFWLHTYFFMYTSGIVLR